MRTDSVLRTKSTLIAAVTELREKAISAGFDWPTQKIETAEYLDLLEFYLEVLDFLATEKQK
jgi:hypothetical protein